MIKSFRHKGLKRFFEEGAAKGTPLEMTTKLELRLDALNAAEHVGEMNIPGWDLHELKGQRKGAWSVKVTGNYRLTFRFQGGNAYDVNLEDYH